MADDGGYGEEFEFGPVGGEGCEGFLGGRGEPGCAVRGGDVFPAEDGDGGVGEGTGCGGEICGDGSGVEGGVIEGGGGGGDVDAEGGAEEGLVLEVLADAGEVV